MTDLFRRFARVAADVAGSPLAFLLGVVATLIWAATGSYFHYSDTWQLVINTGTSVATFLIVFLIQNTQNRDAKVMQLKLDELLRAVSGRGRSWCRWNLSRTSSWRHWERSFKTCESGAERNLERVKVWRQRQKSLLLGHDCAREEAETLCQEGAKAPCCAEDEGRPFGVAL